MAHAVQFRRTQSRVTLALATALSVIGAIAIVAGPTRGGDQTPAGVVTVRELLRQPDELSPVAVYGEIAPGERPLCPCFRLQSGGDSMVVWYDLVLEDDSSGSAYSEVRGLDDGDRVIVVGSVWNPVYAKGIVHFRAQAVEPID